MTNPDQLSLFADPPPDGQAERQPSFNERQVAEAVAHMRRAEEAAASASRQMLDILSSFVAGDKR